MDWKLLLVKKRFSKNLGKNEPDDNVGTSSFDSRSIFEKDYDRIIFSSSFRRLGKKTQVHPLSKNDHLHTRLTHSLETASIGRSLGFKVAEEENALISEFSIDRINCHDMATIVQTACLAHDIGNPPFGHAGEEAIRQWFKENNDVLDFFTEEERNDFLYWEGNAQAFRVLTQIEHHLFEGGMCLTLPILGAMMKYPWTSSNRNEKNKYGCFWEERDMMDSICSQLGLKKTQGVIHHWSRYPLAFLTEAADDICYRILDIEDAHELRLISFEDAKELFLCVIEASSEKKYDQIHGYLKKENLSPRRKLSYLRALALNVATMETVSVFKKHRKEIMNGDFQDPLLKHFSKEMQKKFIEMSEISSNKIFKEKRKVELEIGAYSVMATLLENFCRAAREVTRGGRQSFKTARICDLMGENVLKKDNSTYQGYLRVMDYIAGMTDNYATYIANQLSGFGL
jgi:dGTPase